ncbi:MAG TPA: DNA translocase FtsK [Nitrospiria bacterium]|nr:DNA translocase FtsK [Nitrospiria bacterium]
MFNPKESRDHLREVLGIVLITLGLLLGVSLLTYSPEDASLSTITSDSAVQNAVGRFGAVVSDLFLQGFGYSSYLFPVFLLAVGVGALRGGERRLTGKSLAGSFLFLLSSAGLLALDFESASGNLAGHLLAWLLTTGFARLGAHLVLIPALLLSLAIALNFSLRESFIRIGTLIRSSFRRVIDLIESRVQVRRGQRRRAETRPRPNRPVPVVVSNRGTALPLPPEVLQADETPRQEAMEFVKEGEYEKPMFQLLTSYTHLGKKSATSDHQRSADVLKKKLADFDIQGEVTEIHPGPVVTLYKFEPAPGIKVNRIVTLSDDLALAMKALQVRIIAPIPGESTVGIEIPNPVREEVFLREILESKEFDPARATLPLALGKDIFGHSIVVDLAKMPHLLVAGATGSGKSVGLNAMILSLLFSRSPKDLRFLMIDPKRLELTQYDGIPHLLAKVVVNAKEAAKLLRKVTFEMDRRYQILAERGVRNIEAFNAHGTPLPYIVVIIDELADLMMVASRDVEESISRLAQMARAAGIHLILATQRPSVDVLTGVIKANFPARISFYVSSKTDSRTILDANGAEQLLGKGDMLFLSPGSGKITRIHGSYVSEEDTRKVVEHVRKQGSPDHAVFGNPEPNAAGAEDDDDAAERDELYQRAIDLVTSTGQASASFIQRRMRVGYPRAARMIEMMEEDGIVGPASGGKPREILLKNHGAQGES